MSIITDLVANGKDEVFEEQVSVQIGGRRYGDTAPLSELFNQPVPAEFILIAEEIENQSRLLKLQEGVSRQEIFAAYAADLGLLKKYKGEFEETARQAVRHSIVFRKDDSLSPDRQWKELQVQIPPVGRRPLLELSSTRAAKGATELLAELKEEFGKGLVLAIQQMAFWLQLLVDEEFVGLVRWVGPDVSTYHYFMHEQLEKSEEKQKLTEQTSEPDKPFGERVTYKEIEERTIYRRHLLERHVHHIVDARLWKLSQFPERVPDRVRLFLEAVPEWLKPHLNIVSGQITMEEKVRKMVHETTEVERETISVWKGSPAVTLGSYALVGWSADDLEDENSGQTKSTTR